MAGFKMPKFPKLPKVGKVGGVVGAVGLSSGAMLAMQLGSKAIDAGAAVGGAAIVADTLKDLFNHPEAMLAVAAVVAVVLLK